MKRKDTKEGEIIKKVFQEVSELWRESLLQRSSVQILCWVRVQGEDRVKHLKRNEKTKIK